MKLKIWTTCAVIILWFNTHAQIFEMMKPYTGSHYGFTHFDPAEINQFVIDFNEMWRDDIETGFDQYSGSELGQTFAVSGTRFVFGKNETKWTFSTDYAIGTGKKRNEAVFKNGVTQIFNLRSTSNQISTTFGVALKENKVWLEGMYTTHLKKIVVEYATVHLNGIESYGTEYKLNGLYKGTIKTMELGIQTSYRKKRYVMYARVMYPFVIVGPDANERRYFDERTSQPEPNAFPANYQTYVNDPQGHLDRGEHMNTELFRGLTYGFGIYRLFGKIEEE